MVPWLAAAIALVTGLLEPALLLLRRSLQDMPVEGDEKLLWMAPVANLVFFLPLGAALQLAVSGLRRPAVVRASVIVLCTTAIFALLAIFRLLYPIAWLLLAIGIAMHLSRAIVRRPQRANRWARRTVVALSICVMLFAAASAALPGVREFWRLRGLPTPAAEAPNVLLLVLDTVRWRSLSLSGYERLTTPALDAWAAEGVTFERAIATSPWTLPTHASMFTGRYPHELEAGFKTPLERAPRTLAEVLAGAGYATAGFVANRRYGSAEFGLARGFARYVDYRVSIPQILVSASIWHRILWYHRTQDALGYYDLYGRVGAATVNRELLAWLDAVDRPFFAFLNYYDAHDPYLPPPPYDDRYSGRSRSGRPSALEHVAPREVEFERDMYEATITYLDAQLGELRDSLAARGLLENTIVIITSDHGEQFGENGLMGHGNSLYSPLLRVPLVVVHPRSVPSGRRVADWVTLRDLPRTITSMVEPALRDAFPGSSLAQAWNGSASDAASPLLAELTWPDGSIAYALVRDHHLFIDWFQERDELYDLAADPYELRDLARGSDSTAVLLPFRALRDSLVGHVRREEERGM